jgi:hypothetical protein
VSEEPQFRALIRRLASNQVAFVAVGGIAMILRAADYVTFDLDVCYERCLGTYSDFAGHWRPFAQQYVRPFQTPLN